MGWRTVAAVTRAALPRRQPLRLCRQPDCPLIYFGAAGARIPVAALALPPWFKGGETVCFCFLQGRQELAAGAAAVREGVEERVRAGDCACDLRNPTGKCCLPDLRRLDPDVAR